MRHFAPLAALLLAGCQSAPDPILLGVPVVTPAPIMPAECIARPRPFVVLPEREITPTEAARYWLSAKGRYRALAGQTTICQCWISRHLDQPLAHCEGGPNV